MKAIGEVHAVGGTHFVNRTSLLAFLDQMIAAQSVDNALRAKHEQADLVPRSAALRLSLPEDLRRVTLKDFPENVMLGTGEVRVTGANAEQIREGPVALAQVRQNDLESVRVKLDPPANPDAKDDELRGPFAPLRRRELTVNE